MSSGRKPTQSSTAGSPPPSQNGSSRSSRSERTRGNSHPAVESAVTRLLVAIKQLLEALTLWSTMKINENQVSDVYVRLGNDFNAAVAAFAAFNIDMAELMSVPDDLRTVLEQCLAEDATPENLELYLPNVRAIITNLLQGLRGKQSIYRRIVSDHRQKSSASEPTGGHDRTDSRSLRSERSSSRRDGAGSHRSQLSRTLAEHERAAVSLDRDNESRKSTASSSGRRRDQMSSQSVSSNGDDPFVGGFVPPIPQGAATPESDRSSVSRKQPTMPPAAIDNPHAPESFSQSPPIQMPPTIKEPMSPPVPASVKRYSLVDKPAPAPAPAPTFVVDEPEEIIVPDRNSTASPPAPETPPPLDTLQAPAIANSLAALKQSDTLERRASKRFSTYNITKMTGATTRERPVRGGHPNRRSLAASSALTPGELDVLTEVDEDPSSGVVRREGSFMSRRTMSRPSTPDRKGTPPVPPIPSTPARTPEPVPPSIEPAVEPKKEVAASQLESPTASQAFSVFLQLGREVKKATIEPGLSFSSLRVLFVDKFSYNPGLDNFPAIYIRDPSSGVQYELEDVDEVKEQCLLSLNIEPLDQIKQHIDAQISTLSQDIKDLRTAVTSTSRQPTHIPAMLGQPLAESTPRPRPTDRRFQDVARRLSRFVGESSPLAQTSVVQQTPPFVPVPTQPPQVQATTIQQIQPQMTGQTLQPQMTGGSVLSEYSNRIVTDLKTQFDEVQNLRRDLGIMRQLYTEFMKNTKESLGALRGQTQSVKQLANAKVGGARAYIDSGKTKLDNRSQNVLTDVERLQDTVEGIKDDVLKRHITPKPQQIKNIKNDIDSVAKELDSLKEHIKTVKPMWKKTWEEELQNIVEEQQFLSHQEEFLSDLLEDHKAVVEVYGHVEKVINLRGTGSSRVPRNRSFKPPLAEEGHTGLSTVMIELRGAAVDPERRMKAIEANQKSRQKELASRSEFQDELSGFVGGKKLKMTGGAEEAERVRQRRNELTMKAMFNGPQATSSVAVPPSLDTATLPPSLS